MERVVQTERQCWANAQYSRRDTVEVIGITSSIREQDLEDKARNIFGEIGGRSMNVPYSPVTDLGRKTGRL